MQPYLQRIRSYLVLHLMSLALLTFQATTISAQSISLGWTPSEDPTVSYYCIYRKSNLEPNFTLIDTISSSYSTYIDEKVQWNLTYSYTITTTDIYNNVSRFSNVIDTTIYQPNHVEFIVLSVNIEGNDAILEWSDSTENIIGFEIQRNSKNTLEFKMIGYEDSRNHDIPIRYYRFVDKNLQDGTYHYRLKIIFDNGSYQYSNIFKVLIYLPRDFHFHQNYPNPFNAATIISYSLPEKSHVELIIYDINGQEVSRLVNKFQDAGNYSIIWDAINFQGKRLSSGVYYCIIKTLNSAKCRRIILLK